MINIVAKRMWFLSASTIILIVGILSLLFPPHLNLGIDFLSGTGVTVKFENDINSSQIESQFNKIGLDSPSIQSMGDKTFFIRTEKLSDFDVENNDSTVSRSDLEKVKASNTDESTGIQIVNKAIETPLRTIVENSGGEGSVVVSKVLEGSKNFGYNAKEGKYVDMLKEGIIDPKKVTRVALENAASVAGMILTTECALVDIKEDNPAPMPPMGGGGGMPGMM